MPRVCSICTHERSAEITKALTAGGSKQQVADRFSVSPSAVQRHRTACLRLSKEPKASTQVGDGNTSGGPVRFGSSDAEIASPKDLLERLRSLFRLGDLLEEAYQKRDIDACVKLAREYRAAAESYAKVAGWMTDGSTLKVTIDQRQQVYAKLATLSEDELRALAGGDSGGAQDIVESVAIGAQDITDNRRLPVAES